VGAAGSVLVDAANVVGSRPDGWWRDRAAATRRLRERLVAHGGAGLGEVVLVLEGRGREGLPAGPDPAGPWLTVCHAPGSGDDLLVSLAGPGDVVVTADAALRARVRARGASVQGPGWLWARLDAEPAEDPRAGRVAPPGAAD
jgi:hypothetical protein